MSWSEHIAALPREPLALGMTITLMIGVGGVVAGIASGNISLVIAVGDGIVGMVLVPVVVDWCRTSAAVEAARRQYRG